MEYQSSSKIELPFLKENTLVTSLQLDLANSENLLITTFEAVYTVPIDKPHKEILIAGNKTLRGKRI